MGRTVYLPTSTIKSTVHVGKYTIPGSYGLCQPNLPSHLTRNRVIGVAKVGYQFVG